MRRKEVKERKNINRRFHVQLSVAAARSTVKRRLKGKSTVLIDPSDKYCSN